MIANWKWIHYVLVISIPNNSDGCNYMLKQVCIVKKVTKTYACFLLSIKQVMPILLTLEKQLNIKALQNEKKQFWHNNNNVNL